MKIKLQILILPMFMLANGLLAAPKPRHEIIKQYILESELDGAQPQNNNSGQVAQNPAKPEEKLSWWENVKLNIFGKKVSQEGLEVAPVTDFQLKETYLQIPSVFQSTPNTAYAIEPHVFYELSILKGGENSPKANILNKLNRCKTIFGYSELASSLANPETNIKNLKAKADFVRYLLANPEIFNQLDDSIKKVKDGQTALLRNFMQNSIFDSRIAEFSFDKLFDKIFLSRFKQSAKENPDLMELNRTLGLLQQGRNALPPFFEHIFLTSAQTMLIVKGYSRLFLALMNANLRLQNLPTITMAQGIALVRNQLTPAQLNEPAIRFGLSSLESGPLGFITDSTRYAFNYSIIESHKLSMLSKIADQMENKFGIAKSLALPLVIAGRVGLDLIWKVRMQTSYENTRFYETLLKNLQAEMSKVARLHEGMIEIDNILQSNQAVSENVFGKNELHEFVSEKGKVNEKLAKLAQILDSNTFKGEPSALSLQGNSLAAYNLLKEVKEHFIKAFRAIGQVDVALSTVRLLKEFENKRVQFCIPEFVKSDKPLINIENGWNPLVNDDVVIPTDFNIGANFGAKDMMITGPNGCGKSTIMKALAYNILLAQSLGIAPSTKCQITPFERIDTSIGVKEDLANNLSTFMAQQARIEDIKKDVAYLPKGKFALVFGDEVASGTTEILGQEVLYDFVKSLVNHENCISISATHFEKPTKLEEETKGTIKNFQVELLEPKEGQFVRTFKLLPGRNEWWFNDPQKAMRFATWLHIVEEQQKANA